MDILSIGLWLMAGACLVMGLAVLTREICDVIEVRASRIVTDVLHLGEVTFLAGAFVFMAALPPTEVGSWLYLIYPIYFLMFACLGALGMALGVIFWVVVAVLVSLLLNVLDCFFDTGKLLGLRSA